jgi:tetratricopeptide (TPR) repeat protein
MQIRSALAAAWALALFAQAAHAAPIIPARDDEVVERLARRADPLQRELQALRARQAAHPQDVALAARVAQRYIGIARSETDPRYYGYAQAALAPWWALAAPPPEVRLLRATLLQSTHHFPEALADLDAIVAADPANAQAWLTKATVQTVRGDYAGATASCAHLSSQASQLVSITCIANVASMTGRSAGSEALLATLLARSGDAEPGMQEWVLTLLAEMAARRGDATTAEARFKQALALDPRDSYLLGAYSDFLLDQKRPQDVVKLVREQTRIDGLLLRQALALQQMPGEAAAQAAATAELKARFAAAMQRGDTVHQREQARFELHLRGDVKTALALARLNWEVQKEPADMRILLEAAVKAGDKGAAGLVLEWMKKNGTEDVALARLARQLKGEA